MKQKTGSFKRSMQLTNLQLDQLEKNKKTQTNNRNERKNNTIDLIGIEKNKRKQK